MPLDSIPYVRPVVVAIMHTVLNTYTSPITGIVLPCDIVTKEFVEELKTIYELSKVAIQNKPSFLGEESEPLQIGLDEFDEQ